MAGYENRRASAPYSADADEPVHDLKKLKPAHLYGLLVEAINDGLAVVDERDCLSFVNGRLCEMLGYAQDELLGRPVTDFFDETGRGIIQKQVIKQQKKGRLSSFEIVWTGKNGKRISTSISSIPMLDSDCRPKGRLEVIMDISKRKESEKALKKSEANLRAIFNNSLQYFVLLDLNKNILAFNHVAKFRAKKFLGLDMHSGDSFLKFVVDEVVSLFNDLFDKSLEGETTTKEFRLKTSDGEYYWVEGNFNPVFAEGEVVSGVCFSLIDINERKKAEEALRESEERYRLLVELSPDANFIFREDRIVFVNNAALKLLGAADESQVIGQPILNFVALEEKETVRKGLADLLTGGRVRSLLERKLVRVDGGIFFAEVAAIPFFYQGRSAVHVIARDISERKRAEADLLNYQAQLRSLASRLSLSEEQERRRIASELHDRIGTSLSLCKIKLEGLPETASPENLTEEHDKIRDLIDQAIQDARSLTLELSPPVLYELGLNAGLEWLADQIRERHGIMVDVEDNGRPLVLDDHVRGVLFRAVRELLINVAKHARADRAKVSIRREGKTVSITVADEGRGFDASAFGDGFSRTGGFGLFSIKERLGHLGGNLLVESRPGQGTRVTLTAALKRGRGKGRKGRS